MITLIQISITLLSFLLITILALNYLDYRKKLILNKKPFVSFLVPCYNDGSTIKETIQSIYKSYDSKNFEIIVVNDKSTDNSLDVLKNLQKIYKFKLVNNKQNLGKAPSLNRVYSMAKSDILFFIDSDVILNKKAIEDILARMQVPEVAAVSCPYKTRNKSFLATMQECQYNFLSFLQGAYNHSSTVSVWGGCFAVKKQAFEKVGLLSEAALVEDMDLALKLNEKGYRVQQSFVPILTYVPDTMSTWYKQQIRWSSGFSQCLIKHYEVWTKHTLHLLFSAIFFILSIFFIINLIKQILFLNTIWDSYTLLRDTSTMLFSLKLIGVYYGALIIKDILVNLYFVVFSVPYVVPMVGKFKELPRLFYVFPFAIIYTPLYMIIFVVGFVTGVVRYSRLESGERAW